MASFSLTTQQVKHNIEQAHKFMAIHELDALYISSFDEYLNEYVPMSDCHRYYVTGFNGSTAEVLIPAGGKPKLYVDGRYHEQADIQCDLNDVEVVKVPANTALLNCLQDDLKSLGAKSVGIEAERTAVAFYEKLKESYDVLAFHNKELAVEIDFATPPAVKPVYQVSNKLAGTSVADKLKRIFTAKDEAYFVTALDSLAWITNCRGYHLPHNCAFLGKGLITADKVYVFIDENIQFNCQDDKVEFIPVSNESFSAELTKLKDKISVNKLLVDKRMLNANLFEVLSQVFDPTIIEEKAGGLVDFHSIKDAAEIDLVRGEFKKADKAIFNTIKWLKSKVKAGEKVSELDLYHQTSEEYKKQGAVEQSFGTIPGIGANGSIIHYGDPKADVFASENDMILLDSGGYFETGFATDTTRTFMGGDKPGSAKHKEIYTLVLKGLLRLQNATFKSETRGGGLDAICRQPLYEAGYDYAHGTGHGVGLNVHEGGVGISPVRNYLLKPGQVVSMEPGIYISGFGGVRLENIGLVIEHPKHPGFLAIECLVYIGFEPGLIEESLLNSQEKKWLDEYEAECSKRGTSFRV